MHSSNVLPDVEVSKIKQAAALFWSLLLSFAVNPLLLVWWMCTACDHRSRGRRWKASASAGAAAAKKERRRCPFSHPCMILLMPSLISLAHFAVFSVFPLLFLFLSHFTHMPTQANMNKQRAVQNILLAGRTSPGRKYTYTHTIASSLTDHYQEGMPVSQKDIVIMIVKMMMENGRSCRCNGIGSVISIVYRKTKGIM